MVLEIIGGAILIAFGILAIYFSLEESITDDKLIPILIVGVVCIIGGAWLLVMKLTLIIILQKVAGIILAGAGLFLIIGFPTIPDYQPKGMGRAGIFIGIIIFIIGAYFVLF